MNALVFFDNIIISRCNILIRIWQRWISNEMHTKIS